MSRSVPLSVREAAALETTVLQPPVGHDHPLLDQFQQSSQGARSRRKLLSDPLFHQKDLFAPATIEETLQAAGDVVHLGGGPLIPLRVRLGILLTRGVILLPSRGVCSRTIRLPMDDSLLLLLVLLCLGGNHSPSHLTSLPQIRPDAHFTKGGESSPPPPPLHQTPRLPV